VRCEIAVNISVIVPVYNVGDYLRRCIDSLIAQTIVDQIEILLIDDGSTDGCGLICDEYSGRYSFISTIHQQNKGVSSARNTGIDNSKGEYIAFVDADDYVDADFFEKMFIAAQRNDADLVVFDYWLTFENGVNGKYRKSTMDRSWERKEALKDFLSGGLIGINLFDKLFKKRCVKTLRFDENIKVGEDLFFIFNFLLNVKQVYGDFQAGYYYFQRNGSAMKEVFSEKYFDVLDISERIRDMVKTEYPDLLGYAEALCIHSDYKTLERAFKFHADERFSAKLDRCRKNIKKYKFIDAIRFLSKKQFVGFCLFRTSPRIYLFVCEIMKI